MTKSTQQDNKATPRDILTAYMTEQQMRKTPERYAIMEVVMGMEGHKTADQILAMMPKTFHVSRGSIYNTLPLLVECGLAVAHYVEGATLYEKAYGCKPHHHYICTGCGKLWDLNNEQIEQAVSKARTPKFKKIRCSTYIYGLCNVCMAKLARMRKKIEREKLANMSREEKRFAKIDEELAKAAEWFK